MPYAMFKCILFTICLLVFLSLKTTMAAEIALSGYLKKYFIVSKTSAFFPPEKSYLLDFNRFRFQFDGTVSDSVSFNVQYDNEILLGDYLQTNEFIFGFENRQPDTRFDLQQNYLDNKAIFGRHRVYRAYVDIALPQIDLRVGRQRIAWGTAMMWNPMDILNPFDPIQLERQEREGIDAALLDWNLGDLSRLSLVYASQLSGDSGAARWRTNVNEFDFSLMAGQFRGDTIGGFDFAGQILNMGIRGEVTRTESVNYGVFTRAVVGADYTFANTLSFNVELYFNGEGKADVLEYQFARLFSGEIQSLARRYAGLYMSYEFTPLLTWNSFLIANLDDGSIFSSPNLVYSVSDNAELAVGLQSFTGDEGGEFSGFNNVYYIQFQLFY